MERLSEYVGIFAGSVARGEVRSKGVWVEARGTSGFAVDVVEGCTERSIERRD